MSRKLLSPYDQKKRSSVKQAQQEIPHSIILQSKPILPWKLSKNNAEYGKYY